MINKDFDVKPQSLEFMRDENRLHLVVYHLAWTPKRRKPVLTGDIAADCRCLIKKKKCDERGWHIYRTGSQP